MPDEFRRRPTPPPIRYAHANANLTLAHCLGFTVAMLLLAFWSLTILESQLAAASTSPLVGEDRQAPRAEGDRLAELGEG